MSYNSNIPDPNLSPALLPAQSTENFTRLKKIIGGDHQFNDGLQVPDTDGYHNIIHMTPQTPPTNQAGYGQFYGVSNGTNRVDLRYMDGTITAPKAITDFAPSVAITFTGLLANNTTSIPLGPVNSSYIYSSYNVLELYKIDVGRYRIAFSTSLRNDNYTWIFSGTGISVVSTVLFPTPIRANIYNPNITGYEAYSTGQICFEIREQTTNVYKDPKQFSVLILGG